MGKLEDGILGKMTGKVGPVVGGKWKGMNNPEAEPRGIKRIFLLASDPEGRGIKPKN